MGYNNNVFQYPTLGLSIMPTKVSLSLIVADDSGNTIEVPTDVPIGQLLERIKASLEDKEPASFVFYLAHEIGTTNDDLQKTLAEFNIKTGDALHIVRLNTGSSKLQFFLPGEAAVAFEIAKSPCLIGRDPDDPGLRQYPLDIDLSKVLPPDQHSIISRRQATFFEKNGQWWVQAHERAKAPMFVNNQRLSDKPIRLEDEALLTIGVSQSGGTNIHFNLRLITC